MMIRRPPVALSFVLYPSGGRAAGAAGSAAGGVHSAGAPRRRGFGGEGDPFSGDHAALSAIDPDVEIRGRQVGYWFAMIVDDRNVERSDFDRRLEARFGRWLLFGTDDGPAEAGHDGNQEKHCENCPTCLTCLTHYFPATAR